MLTAIGAFFTSTRTVKPLRFGFGGYHKPPLIGAIVDKIDDHPAQRFELIDQVGVDVGANTVCLKETAVFIRLIQSQSQNGTASAKAEEIYK